MSQPLFLENLVFQADAAIDENGKGLDRLHCDLDREASRLLTMAKQSVDDTRTSIANGISRVIVQAKGDIEQFACLVVGLGPASTLQLGFAIARDDEGRTLTSRAAALNHPSFRVEFRDGRLPVANQNARGKVTHERRK